MSGTGGTKGPGSRLPPEVLWIIGTLSMVLPIVGGAVAATGLWKILSGGTGGWSLLIAGLALFAIDIVIDLWIANPKTMVSEDPDLNDRGAQVIGRSGILCEAIVAGRGKLKVGDTIWTVAGRDLPKGTRVKITGSQGTVLQVEPADPGAP